MCDNPLILQLTLIRIRISISHSTDTWHSSVQQSNLQNFNLIKTLIPFTFHELHFFVLSFYYFRFFLEIANSHEITEITWESHRRKLLNGVGKRSKLWWMSRTKSNWTNGCFLCRNVPLYSNHSLCLSHQYTCALSSVFDVCAGRFLIFSFERWFLWSLRFDCDSSSHRQRPNELQWNFYTHFAALSFSSSHRHDGHLLTSARLAHDHMDATCRACVRANQQA